MKKLIVTLCFIIVNQLVFAQQTNNTISIEFKDISRMEAIQLIESKTPYKFYFDLDWIQADKSLISGAYRNVTIESLLNSVFSKTTLNFIVLQNKIILTNNSLIYDKLAANYFATPTNTSVKNPNITTENPVFYRQYDSVNNYKKNSTITFIGKETKKDTTHFYLLSGYIKNAITQKPEPDIAVRVKSKNISTVTDKEGYYILKVPGGINTIETTSIIHQKIIKTVMVYKDGKLDIEVADKANQLDEIIVHNKEKRAVETVISGLVSIDIKNIKNIPLILGELDILKVATTFPGIKTTGEGSAGFNVRGGKEDQNLILLDNAVLYNPQHFFGFFSAINPYTASKANIYKGSIPTEFGGRLSSVFEVITKNGDSEKVSGEGGIGIITSNISVSFPVIKNKASLLVGARSTYSDWVLKSLNDESLKKSEAGFYDGIIKYNHTIDKKNAVELTLNYSHDRFRLTSDSLYKYSNRLAALKWDHTFNKKNKASLIFTNSEYKFNIDYDTEGTNAFDFGYKIDEKQVLLKFNTLLNDKHKLNYGLSSKLYNIDPGFLSPKKTESLLLPINIQSEKGLESALYVSDEFKVSNKLLINYGLRYSFYASLGESTQRVYAPNVPLNDATVIGENHFAKNEVIKTFNGIEPRFAARYSFTDSFSIKASYDKTYQFIHLLSNNVTQSPTDSWKLSDSNVDPQSAQQYSLGLYKNLNDDILELSLEGYYKRSKNILDYKVGAQLVLNKNIETELLQGQGKAYGIELLLKKQMGRLNGWLGYSYSRTYIKMDSEFNEEKVNNGNYFPANFDKPHDVTAVLNYKLTKRYSISSNFVYQTGRPITYPIGAYVYNNAEYTLYSDRNKYRIEDYYRLDIGVNIEGNHKIKKLAHSFWNISIYNVLGRSNPYSVYFVTENDGQIKAYKTSIFSIPIPSITYNFKF